MSSTVIDGADILRSDFPGGLGTAELVRSAAPEANVGVSASTLLIVDGCQLRRDYLADHFATLVAEVRCAWNLTSFDDEIANRPPEVILLNMDGEDSRAVLEHCGGQDRPWRVVVSGLPEDSRSIIACAAAGASGYHLRSESLADLTRFTQQVLASELGCSARVSAILLKHLAELTTRGQSSESGLFTAREQEVYQMLKLGLSNREIAARLCIATHTVKNHVHNVLTKLGARSRAEAIAMSQADLPSRAC